MSWRGVPITAALAAFALSGAQVPASDAAWGPPMAIGAWVARCELCSDPTQFDRPRLAVAPDGAAVAAWDLGPGIWAAVRPAGGPWQAPVELGKGEMDPVKPLVAIDPAGLAVAIWPSATNTAGTSRMRSASISIGHGSWSAPQTIPGPVAAPSSLALDRRGDAALAWIDYFEDNEDGGTVLVSYRRAGAAAWPVPARIGGGPRSARRDYAGLARGPQVAFDSHGDLTALWGETRRREGDQSPSLIEARSRNNATQRWGRVSVLSRSEGGYFAGESLAVAANGAGTASWHEGTGHGEGIDLATRPAALANWRSPTRLLLSARGFEDAGFYNNLVIDARGAYTLAFHAYDGAGTGSIGVASGSARSGRRPGITRFGEGEAVTVAANNEGAVALGWVRVDLQTLGPPLSEVVTAALRAPGGGWMPAEELSPEGQSEVQPVIALDGHGRATAVWLARDGTVEASETG
jgi:hypothetical protein